MSPFALPLLAGMAEVRLDRSGEVDLTLLQYFGAGAKSNIDSTKSLFSLSFISLMVALFRPSLSKKHLASP